MKKDHIFILSFLFFLIMAAGVSAFFYTQKNIIASPEEPSSSSDKNASPEKNIPDQTTSTPEKKDVFRHIPIESGNSYTSLMEKAGIKRETAAEILETAAPVYDLTRIKSGKELELTLTPEKELKKLVYQIDSEEQLVATASASSSSEKEWTAKKEPIPYETKVVTAEGTITTSMYRAAQEEDIDIRAIIELAEAFQWTIDFAMETRKGDTFKFIYEKKYLDGEYVRPGRILAAQYTNKGEKHEIYYYEEPESENKGYFTPEGKSTQKMFLKAPVSYKYISSGYTQGPRYLSKFKKYTSSHKAIDYAAESGTPIRSVGNGVVTTAGWNSSGYGYLTAIRHNSTYTTRYAHQSKILVNPGQKVKQGEVIGYVGNTGLSTGPHLHYEMIKHGQKINPLDLELPPAQSVSEENMENFREAIAPHKEILRE